MRAYGPKETELKSELDQMEASLAGALEHLRELRADESDLGLMALHAGNCMEMVRVTNRVSHLYQLGMEAEKEAREIEAFRAAKH